MRCVFSVKHIKPCSVVQNMLYKVLVSEFLCGLSGLVLDHDVVGPPCTFLFRDSE